MAQDKNSAWEGSLEAVASTDTSGSVDSDQIVGQEKPASGKKKVCCVCGKDIAHEQRFKDKTGRYWCTDCNRLDEAKKRPAKCPDCQEDFTEADLLEYEGTKICRTCADKRFLAKKRESARIAAAQAEAEEQAKRNHLVLVIVGAIVGAGLLYALVMFIVRMVSPA